MNGGLNFAIFVGFVCNKEKIRWSKCRFHLMWVAALLTVGSPSLSNWCTNMEASRGSESAENNLKFIYSQTVGIWNFKLGNLINKKLACF